MSRAHSETEAGPGDGALARSVLEIESHVASQGWDQGARLYALAETASLVVSQPELAQALGAESEADAPEGSLTAIEQELPADQDLESMLESIEWPEQVDGCAAVVERLVLPPDADEDLPEDYEAAQEFARQHPDRQEVRIVAAATRGGATYCAMRLRAHDDDQSVVTGPHLVPELVELLGMTLIPMMNQDAEEQG